MPDDEALLARIEALHASLRRELARVIHDQVEHLLQEHRALKPLMDLKDVAITLGVSERTVENLIAAGRLRPLWIKGQRRFHPDAIDAYLRTCARRARRNGKHAR